MRVAEHCNQLPVHPRHPYVGDLVFTAFSGSHQDAIKKGFAAMEKSNSRTWEIPYLPIDPEDVGRSYESVIRINSQSGKGGVAYIMETDYGIQMPRRLQIEFSHVIQNKADNDGEELSSNAVWKTFEKTYLSDNGPYGFSQYRTIPDTHASEIRNMTATLIDNGVEIEITGKGRGPIDSFIDAFSQKTGHDIKVVDYHEHAIGHGADTQAVAFIEMEINSGPSIFGVGRDANITEASLKAVISAVNRALS
jgi:2-isopropylmalate synthase